MASLGKWTPLVVLALVATLFAGCVGDEDVDPEDPGTGEGPDTTTGGGGGTSTTKTGDDETPKEDTAKAGCKFQFCIEGHVYAPVWDVGMTWTYDVSGTYFPTSDYSAKFGVFKVNEDHFLLGTDSDQELKNSIAREGVMIGSVQKDSYGVLEHEAYQDLLGFLKIEDTSWKAMLWEKEFTLVKEPSKEIEHAKGKSLGIEVVGATEAGDTLLIQYASDAAWLTKLEWKGPEGEVLLSYTLTDYNHDDSTNGFKIWDRTKRDTFRAVGNTAPAGAFRWMPGSAATYVLAHIETDAGVAGNAIINPPDNQYVQVTHTGPQSEDIVFPYQGDDWSVAILIDRGAGSGSVGTGNMAVFMYSVIERA